MPVFIEIRHIGGFFVADKEIDVEELERNLGRFHGSEEVFLIHRNPKVLVTEGVKFLAEKAECYWLIDIVYSCQFNQKVKKEPFQTYELTVDIETGKADIFVHDGNNNSLYEQHIPITTFPLPKQTLYFQNDVLMLPSEY